MTDLPLYVAIALPIVAVAGVVAVFMRWKAARWLKRRYDQLDFVRWPSLKPVSLGFHASSEKPYGQLPKVSNRPAVGAGGPTQLKDGVEFDLPTPWPGWEGALSGEQPRSLVDHIRVLQAHVEDLESRVRQLEGG